jgi:predicted hotdog family 3-hydroxylacyl-ACP dehydratase
MGMPDIRTLVPHSGKMLLLDRVVSSDEESLVAEVTIRSDSLFCAHGGVGAWAGMEYMAQAIAAYIGYRARLRGAPVKIGLLLGLRRYHCSCPIFALGSVLRVYVQCVFRGDDQMAAFECRIDDLERPVATATITVFQPANANDFLKGITP